MEAFSYDFMQRALAAGLVIALLCPLIGFFVVVRRQSLIGDGLGHLAFAGVTGASLLGVYPVVGALAVTVLGSLGIEWVRQRHRAHSDMGLAIVFYAGMALAVLFSTMNRMGGNSLLSVLFGSILTVTPEDVWSMVGCGLVVGFLLLRMAPKLLCMAFDEEMAYVSGMPVKRLNCLFSILMAVVVVLGMRIVGILLVSALMIVPVAAALQFRKGFRVTLALAELFALLAVLWGLSVSFYLDMAPGGTIVLCCILLYLAAGLAAKVFCKE